jgi:hypothetical protein
MVWSGMRLSAWLEVLVMVFQIAGVAALFLSRLSPASRWGRQARVGFVVAMLGLGITGSVCGGHDSAFALFAGGTMTFLLIGMTVGSGHVDTTAATRPRAAPGRRFAC